MTNKKFWLGMLVLVLVFGMMVVGCGKDDDDKEWTDVTSLKQLIGTWKGTYSGTEPIEETDFTIKYEAEIIMTITATKDDTGTVSGNLKTTMTILGDGIDADLWDLLKLILSGDAEEEDGVTVTYNDAKHSITINQTISDTITLEEMAGAKINKNGTKIKQPANKEEKTPEIIFTKQ